MQVGLYGIEQFIYIDIIDGKEHNEKTTVNHSHRCLLSQGLKNIAKDFAALKSKKYNRIIIILTQVTILSI